MEAGRRGELRRIMRFLYVFSKYEPEEEQGAAEGDGNVEDELSDDEPAREERGEGQVASLGGSVHVAKNPASAVYATGECWYTQTPTSVHCLH
tara:strand:+ start:1180 stop:1458 length:279 start_codon:yes stop_codon:yes gene_type:complete